MTNPHDSTQLNSEQVDISKFPSPWGPDSVSGVSSNADSAPYLGTFTNTASASLNDGEKTRLRDGFNLRFALQSAARELLPDHRVAWCLRRPLPDHQTVDVMHSAEHQRAYYANLMSCAAIWECPVCAARITEQRRQDLYEGLKNTDYHLAMLTFTIQHSLDESCQVVIDRLLASYRRFTSGRWYQGFKDYYGIRGTLKGFEITYGENGWHPHLHVLLLIEPGLPMLPNTNMAAELLMMASNKWRDIVQQFGGYAHPTYGVDLTVGNEHLGLYVSKLASEAGKLAATRDGDGWTVADEITKYPVKRGRGEGRTLLELLADYLDGDHEAGELWREAVNALYGKKHLSPSRGFWSLLGRDDDKVPTDDELAQERIALADVMLASLSLGQWRSICRKEARAAVLEVASDGDSDALWAFLAELGIDRPVEVDKTVSGPPVRSARWLRVNLDDCSVQTVVRPSGDAPIWTGKHWEW